MLTRKQHELLLYIQRELLRCGVPPSFDEMKAALHLKSKSGIHRLITGLEERGFIRRLPHRARALEIVRLPESLAARAAAAKAEAEPERRFAPNVIQGRFPMGAVAKRGEGEPVSIPLYGRIAAGTPIEALRDQSTFIDMPAAVLGSGEHYALEVDGDSMVEAGILDGDTVVIQRCDTADTGAIVVALIDNEEATLKRLRRRGNSVALEAANPAYETRIFGPDRVKIQGRMIGLFRRY